MLGCLNRVTEEDLEPRFKLIFQVNDKDSNWVLPQAAISLNVDEQLSWQGRTDSLGYAASAILQGQKVDVSIQLPNYLNYDSTIVLAQDSLSLVRNIKLDIGLTQASFKD